MSFAPQEGGSGEGFNYPKFKQGEEGVYNVAARISVLCDLGIQSRPDFVEEYDDSEKGQTYEKHKAALERSKNPATLYEDNGKTYISIPQTDVRACAMFVDYPNERVDYGDLGEKAYRQLINGRDFKTGDIRGFALTVSHPRSPDGKQMKDKPKTFSPRSTIAQLAKATGVSMIKNGNDITQLVNVPFLATVENKITGSGNVFTKFSSAAPLVEGMQVPELDDEPLIISFENATAEQIKFLWKNVVAQIKKAKDYEGSQIQKAIQEYEAEANNGSGPENNSDQSSDDNTDDDSAPF